MLDSAPIVRLALLGVLLALGPLAWTALRHRGAAPGSRLRALAVTTLFLTFDLVLFGAFTRLTDSGLGCPDWPGCYGHLSPVGAQAQIGAAQSALPSGAVTHGKAWIEMTHRYLAAAVGVLIFVLAVAQWLRWRADASRAAAAGARAVNGASAAAPGWATATLLWVCLQGAFGALTVTMKLYPAIVTAHLLGGLGLLALLAVQVEKARPGPRPALLLPAPLRRGVLAVAALGVVQIALGGWVSTNYAVLACRDFPTCQQSWWPPMDFAHGFELARGLGVDADGAFLPFAALTAIHVAHRLGAGVVLVAIGVLAWRLHIRGDAALRRWARALAAVALWQLASGLGNVVLGWPLAAAVAHTGGAAALVVVLTTLLARAAPARRREAVEPAPTPMAAPFHAAPPARARPASAAP